MKAIVTKEALLSALETCAPVTEKNHTNPVFGRVRLRLSKELRFTALNEAVTVMGVRPIVECDGAADFCFSVDVLAEAARRFPDGAIKLSIADDVLTATAAKRSLKIVVIPSGDYPDDPKPPRKNFTRIPASALASVVSRVHFCMSEEGRSHDGIRIVSSGKKLEAVAFDGRKAARAEADCEAGSIDFVLPPRLVPSLISATEKSAALVGVCEEESALWLETEGGLFRYLSAQQGNFRAPVREALERETGAAFRSPTKPILDAIKYVEMASGREAPTLYLMGGEGKLRMRAIDGQRETTDEVEVDGTDEFSVKINPRFFADALSSAGDECTVTRGENMLRVTSSGFDAGIARLFE